METRRRACCFLSILSVLILFSPSLCEFRGYPVVLIPGDGGSQVLAKLNKTSVPHFYCEKKTEYYFNLWLTLDLLAPYVIDCFIDNMRLHYDPVSHKTSNTPGVDIQIPGFGGVDSVAYLDPSQLSVTEYFHSIIQALETKLNYTAGVNLRGAPYDFRKAPNELGDWFVNLTKLIEDTYYNNSNIQIITIGHSMGNPNALYFFNRHTQGWKDKFIKSHISLAGVWGGAVKTLRLMTAGDNLDVPIVSGETVRPEQRSMPSTTYLMPSDKFWSKDEPLVISPNKNYTVNDYADLFHDINYTTGYLMWKDTGKLIYDLTPPGVEFHCLHGYNISTPAQVMYTKSTWPSGKPVTILGNGDGTVNIRSLLGCERWKGKQKQPVIMKQFAGAEHMQILHNKDVVQYVVDTVQRR